jgi:ABC-2 type transport system permease protein
VSARRESLLPNAGIVARHEYLERVRSKLFVASTLILMVLATALALAPIAITYASRAQPVRIGVVATDQDLQREAVGTVDRILNPTVSGDATVSTRRGYLVEGMADRAAAEQALQRGTIGGVIVIERGSERQLTVTFRTNDPGNGVLNQLVSFAAVAVGILDWSRDLPPESELGAFVTPEYLIEGTNVVGEGGGPVSPEQAAGRSLLGVVFVFLLSMSVAIYGMWVATSIAVEKSSRVMELMVSAASPRQMLIGKVVGIGSAGLTQYLAIAVPALLVLAFQEPIGDAMLGPGWAAEGTTVASLTPALLAGYGLFYLLGFALFALIYAAIGAFVSRPDDLQTMSLPLSLVALAGYLPALLVLGGRDAVWIRAASFLPPFSPFVMLARVMVGRATALEITVAGVILAVAVILVGLATIRIYTAGVILYGQRPSLRAFIAAARRAH